MREHDIKRYTVAAQCRDLCVGQERALVPAATPAVQTGVFLRKPKYTLDVGDSKLSMSLVEYLHDIVAWTDASAGNDKSALVYCHMSLPS